MIPLTKRGAQVFAGQDVTNANRAVSNPEAVTWSREIEQAIDAAGLSGIASGTLAERDAYDDEAQGFKFIVTDDASGYWFLHIKDSASSADWNANPQQLYAIGPIGLAGSSDVVGTSTTSIAIGTGAKTFTVVETARGWGIGARLRVSSDADGSNFMGGLITAYSGTTLELDVDTIGGTGTFADWTINLTGEGGDLTQAAADLLYMDIDENVIKNSAINLLQDGGRFTSDPSKNQTISAYQFPAYLTLYNGTTQAEEGEYINNSVTFGGSAGALTPEIEALYTKIRDPAYRRYGVEFKVARITQGAGTASSPMGIDGQLGYTGIFSAFRPTPVNWTSFCHIYCDSGGVGFKSPTGVKLFADGVEVGGDLIILPADGWVSVLVQQSGVALTSVGYQPEPIRIYALPSSEYLIASLAVIDGITNLDPNSCAIPTYNTWPAS